MSFARWVVVFVSIVTTACATIETKTDFSENANTVSNWQVHALQMSKIDKWNIAGRFSARMKDDAWSGSLTWQQRQDVYDIQISGPLNIGSAVITGNAAGASLTAGEKKWSGPNPETIISEHLGMILPLSNLRYWVRGIPAPGEQKMRLAPEGTLNELEQDGWTIRYKTYALIDHNRLPTKIFIEQNGTEVRFVFDQWQLQS